jgi:Fe-S-cluster containining protein
MSEPASETAEFITAESELRILGRSIKLKLEVPTALSPPETLLPTLHTLASTIVGIASEDLAEAGRQISCKAGCAACCYQSVPLSVSEARAISTLVDGMPEPRQTEIRQRFADALARLRPTGILEKMDEARNLPEEDSNQVANQYLDLKVACPFLENNQCSIYEDRPLICREYVVISPAENCSRPVLGNIEQPKLPFRLTQVYQQFDPAREGPSSRRISLVMALEWTEQHSDDIEFRPGMEWLQRFYATLGGEDVPADNGE